MKIVRGTRSKSRAAASASLDQDFARAHRRQDGALGWILEAFEGDPAFVRRRMFGCDAAYLGGLLCVVTAANGEPWNGLLVCTSQDRHADLHAEWPQLAPHPVLGKWLYLSQDDAQFETVARALAARALARDPRIGVEPKPRKRRVKKKVGPPRAPAKRTSR